MERVSKDDIERIVGTINATLRNGINVQVQGRNGYTALDLYDDRGCIEQLTAGTKREVYTYLLGMRRYSIIVGR